jgi:hypothetical protein
VIAQEPITVSFTPLELAALRLVVQYVNSHIPTKTSGVPLSGPAEWEAVGHALEAIDAAIARAYQARQRGEG